jgi:cardiolipin synthase
LFAGVTDVVDGILARKNGWITDVGKVLDPLADKCMQVAALVCLGVSGLVSWWIVAVLTIKEVLLLVGASRVFKRQRIYVQSSWYGKAGTVAFYIVVVLLVSVKNMPDFLRLSLGILLIGYMLFALIMYLLNYKKNIFN